ncbi:O-antigen ligase family protein [Pontibacter roseus]|uniref:O-antigen ligase family protein n=1 Tax=Pontibacter roseus TaxID=336989 RepID=UPI00037B390E|nr:O-antigen ligase family protein [Pontibacter roseus]
MKLNYTFIFALPLVLIVLMDPICLELIAPHREDLQGALQNMLVKGTTAIAFLYSALRIQRMQPFMRVVFVLVTLYLFALVFESYYKYGTPMVYPHVFQKLLIFYYTFFMYTFYKKHHYFELKHVVYLVVIAFVLNIGLINSHALSISAFTNHERGVNASTMYLLVIPFLYFMGRYLIKGGLFFLVMTFVVLFAIIFFQHRTVWVCSIIILAVYAFLVKFKGNMSVNLGKLIPVAVVMTILGIVASAFVFSIYPEIIDKFAENFSDIENYDKQGTGGWRYQQIMSYVPFIQENFVFGMRFEGFELPIQFYRDDLNAPVFEDGMGHFFHSFYVEVLFYLGAVGMLLYLMMHFYMMKKGFGARALDENQILLLSFLSSGIVYGFSYVLPYFFYAVLGMGIAYMENKAQGNESFLPDFARRRRERLQALRGRLQPH